MKNQPIHINHCSSVLLKKLFVIPIIGILFIGSEACKSTQVESESGSSIACLNPIPGKKAPGKYRINLYLETSQSMFGFMLPKKPTQFQSTMWNVVSKLNDEGGANFRIFQTADLNKAPKPVALSSFRKLMNTGAFDAGKQTEIPQLLDSILSNLKKGTVAILVSDLIFSPGDHSPALLAQITTDIRSRFYKKPFASEIIKLTSEFNFRKRLGYEPKSPYYMWIIGAPELVADASKQITSELSAYESVTHGLSPISPTFSILPYSPAASSAMATRCETDKNYYSYTDWNGSEDPIIVPLALNLSSLPPGYQQPAYLKKNLAVECPGAKVSLNSISLKPAAKSMTDKNLIASIGATHLIMLKIERMTRDDNCITINIRKTAQNWVNDISTETDDPLRKRTTGFSKLVSGLDGAYGNDQWLLAKPLKLLITKQSQ